MSEDMMTNNQNQEHENEDYKYDETSVSKRIYRQYNAGSKMIKNQLRLKVLILFFFYKFDLI